MMSVAVGVMDCQCLKCRSERAMNKSETKKEFAQRRQVAFILRDLASRERGRGNYHAARELENSFHDYYFRTAEENKS